MQDANGNKQFLYGINRHISNIIILFIIIPDKIVPLRKPSRTEESELRRPQSPGTRTPTPNLHLPGGEIKTHTVSALSLPS